MPLGLPALIQLDDIALTDQGRSPIEIGRDERSVSVELANGTTKKYIKSVKKTFTLSWTWLPDLASDTVDGHAARFIIKNNFGQSGTTHTLSVEDENGFTEEYIVFVDDYSETLIRRSSGGYFWDVNLTLREQ